VTATTTRRANNLRADAARNVERIVSGAESVFAAPDQAHRWK
jgi:hypothetical protein